MQKNLDDIHCLKMGIKIEKSITLEQLPAYTVSSHLGQYFLVTDNNEKHLYLIVLNNEDSIIAEDLGEYPARGPQGIQGIQGPKGEPGESIRGPQGIQGEQGIRGRPGEGWDALDEIDATPYTPTFTEQANDVKVETSANLIIDSDTPDEDVKVIGLKFEVPKPNLSGYVPTSRTLAGLDLSQNRTASELIDALNILPVENVSSDTEVSHYADGKPRIYKIDTNPTNVYIGIISSISGMYFWELESLLTPSRYYSNNFVTLQNPTFADLTSLTYSEQYALLSDLNNLKAETGSVVIATSDWNNGIATKTISDLGLYDIIQFYPATSTDKTNATNADIFVSASGTTVTFTVDTTPTANITFNYCIIRGTD